jgi:type IV secretion system protein VirD4
METPKWVKYVFGIAVLAAATACAVWLAGFLFFAFSKANPFGKTGFSTWWTYWQFYQHDLVVAKRLKVSAIVAAVLAYGALAAFVVASMREVRSLYGESRFATKAEIAKAGLFSDNGIIVGKWGKRFLMFAGMQFVLLMAPTRSKKGVGVVIPNLLNWNESVVCNDVKLENYTVTSKFRADNGHEVSLFNPFATDGKTHRYNPLGYISDDPRLRVTEILSIGYSIYPGAGRDSFFDDAARNLFLGLCLYLCETPTLPRTIGELLRQSSGKGRPVKEYLQGLIQERNYTKEEVTGDDGKVTVTYTPITQWDGKGLPPLSGECVDALNRFLSTSDNTLSSILASFNVPLTIWVSPIVDAATSANDFDLRDVRKKRMTVYLGIPANKLAEGQLLINLFYTQLVTLNTDAVLHSTPELKFQCLMLMDESTAAGRIGIIDKSNAFIAQYGLRLLTIAQSPSQLADDPPRGYGREGARTLITNHALQILYTPRKQEDANEYSEMLGTYTFKAKGSSKQLGGKGGRSESESDQRRPLMLPQELKEMSQGEEIINLENTKPIKCKKISYYEEPVFIDRLKSVSPSLAKLGKKMPTKEQLEAAFGAGECASPVPTIDFDLHVAVVQQRTREMTVADIEKGIDLRALALDTSKLAVPEGEGVDPDQVEAFVDSFFNALDAAGSAGDEDTPPIDDDGASAPIDDARLAALDASIDLDAGDEPYPAAAAFDGAGQIDQVDPDSGELDLGALMDAMPPDDDAFHDDAAVLAAAEAGEPHYIDGDEPAGTAPALDLSVLDRPAEPPKYRPRH